MKTILFIDFDGTLCFDRFWKSAPSALFEKIQKALFRSETNKAMVGEWMLGKHTSEDVCRFVAGEVGEPYELIWDMLVTDCKTMGVSPAVLEQIQSLRQRYMVILLTDNMDCFNRFTVPALGLGQYFDHIHNSVDTKIFKNDSSGSTFLQLSQKYGVQMNDCSMIDNSASVCDIVRSLGGTAYFVSGEKTLAGYLDEIISK